MSSFSHVALLVTDLDRSREWWTRVMGWTETWGLRFDDGSLGDANGHAGVAGDVVMGQVGGVQVELVRMEVELGPARPLPRTSPGLMLLTVRADLDHVRAEAEVVREVAIGGSTCLIVRDPDGIELAVTPP